MKIFSIKRKKDFVSRNNGQQSIDDEDDPYEVGDGYESGEIHQETYQGGVEALKLVSSSVTRDISRENKYLRLLVLFVAGTSLSSLLAILVLFALISTIASRPPAPAVQMVDGSVIKVTSLQGDDRPASVVRDFVVSTLGGLLTWRSTLPPQTAEELKNPQPDPGIEVITNGGSAVGRVSTGTWKAAFGINSSFRANLLATIARMGQQAGVTSGTAQVVWVPRTITVKGKVENCWNVNVISDLNIVNVAGTSGKSIPFNKEVKVCTTTVLRKTEAEKLYPQPGLADAAIEARASGLEIVSITGLSFISAPEATNQQALSPPAPSAAVSPQAPQNSPLKP